MTKYEIENLEKEILQTYYKVLEERKKLQKDLQALTNKLSGVRTAISKLNINCADYSVKNISKFYEKLLFQVSELKKDKLND